MANFGRRDAAALQQTLNRATIKCSDRCLYQAARWAAELAESLTAHFSGDDNDNDNNNNEAETLNTSQTRPSPADLATNLDADEAVREAQELNRFLLAKSYFDCREFDRCAAVFLPAAQPRMPMSFRVAAGVASSSHGRGNTHGDQAGVKPTEEDDLPEMSQKALFLALYSRYMAGEKRRDEESEMILGPADKGATVNRELVGVSKILDRYFGPKESARSGGGFLEYLFGVVHAKSKNEAEARYWLIRSVHLEPCNWSAWLELNHLVGSVEEVSRFVPAWQSDSLTEQLHAAADRLPHHLCSLLFHLHASQELCQVTKQTQRNLTDLEAIFPTIQFLKSERAMLQYHAKEFEEAEQTFAELVQDDPYRLEYLDNYSNMLFVLNERPKLAFLAQIATNADKFRPETCCIIGNYFSLKSEHEKAVQYFRRALTLDRNFLSAWTLMGHEYVEMKNTHAAIESYRRAVDCDRKDYRAWYGLGQTYDVLEMHLYALNYYRRAALLRPYDAKLWSAVGKCYDKIDKPMESIKAYKRALAVNTFYDTNNSFANGDSGAPPIHPDGWTVTDILLQIANLYERIDSVDTAREYMEMVVAQEDAGDATDDDDDDEEGHQASGIGVTNTTSKARLWLAHHELKRENLARAVDLANELCQDGYEVEEAKAIIRTARSKQDVGRAEDDDG